MNGPVVHTYRGTVVLMIPRSLPTSRRSDGVVVECDCIYLVVCALLRAVLWDAPADPAPGWPTPHQPATPQTAAPRQQVPPAERKQLMPDRARHHSPPASEASNLCSSNSTSPMPTQIQVALGNNISSYHRKEQPAKRVLASK